MKHIITLIAMIATLFAMPAFAQDGKIELTPEQKFKAFWVTVNAVTALAVGPVVLPAAILSGQREGLCKIMRGKYDLNAPDQCAGGQWVFVIPYLKQATGNE
jgi:hypothetical protein